MSRKIIGIFIFVMVMATSLPVLSSADYNLNDKEEFLNKGESISYNTKVYEGNVWNVEGENDVAKFVIGYCGIDDELDQFQTDNCLEGDVLMPGQWLAQSFKPSKEILTRVQLCIFEHGDVPDNVKITVSIRQILDGNDLAKKSIYANDFSGLWIEFDFPDIIVTPGETYYIVSRASWADDDNCYAWFYVYDLYDKGCSWGSFDQGSNWHPKEQEDYAFKTYGRDFRPYIPEAPKGPNEGEIGIEYSFSSSTSDPSYNQVFYMWDWGDGNFSEWMGPYDSGDTCTASYSWDERGVYSIKVRAKNTEEAESMWSDPLIIGIPVRNEAIDQEQTVTTGIGYGAYGSRLLAQSFIPNVNLLTHVSLQIFKKGSPNGVTICIRQDLDGDDLTSVFLPGSEIEGEKKAGWYEFDFNDIETIPGETYYMFWMQHGGDADNIIYWSFGENNKYPRGCAWFNRAFLWEKLQPADHPDPDFCFKTYYVNTKIKMELRTPIFCLFDQIFSSMLEQHPRLFPLLRQLLGLY